MSNLNKAILAADYALKSTCQLYQWKDEQRGTFIANGCVTLFRHGDSYYCFSNSHVFHGSLINKTFFLLQNGFSMTIGGEVFSSSPISSDFPNDDSLDIAIVKFNPTVYKHLLENGNVFLTLNNLRTIPSLTEADVLLIAAYTASKTKIDIKKKGLVFRPLLLQTAPFIKKLKSKAFNQGFHHIAKFPIKSLIDIRNGRKIRAPKPHGISGSGLWLYPIADDQNFEPILIGILSEYHENEAVLVATKIDLFLDLLRQRFDGSLQHPGIELELKYIYTF